MRRLAGLTALLLGLALVTSGCTKLNLFKRTDRPAQFNGPGVGSLAPDIEGEDFEGRRFRLSDYRGKVVVVSFWASWCKPCRDLIPHEQALVQRFGDKKFALLGVNMDEDRAAAMSVMASYGVTWRNWQTGREGSSIKQQWPVGALPTLYVIDVNGIIRYTRNSAYQMENTIDTLLAESETRR